MLAERIEDKDYDEMGDADTDEKDVDVSEEALGEGLQRKGAGQMLNLRPQSTRERYKATIKEFRQFCSAKPESVLNGVKLRGNKKVVNDTIETDKVVAFLKDYYTLRSHIRASGASGTCMSYASVKGAVNALRSLQREQLQQGTPQQRDFLKDKPILSEHMPGIRDVLMTAKRRSIAREAEAYYDRAQNTEDIVELSREQKQELAEFGVKVGAPRHQKNWLITGSRFHLVHAFCYVTGVRGDTMRKASLSDFTLHWMPKEEGPMQCPFMLFVHNKDRNSGSSREHYSGAIRHRQDPLCCVFFALAYHIFLTYIVEKAIPFPDVTPRPEGFTEEADTASLKNFVAESSPGEAITSKEMAEYLIRPWYNQKLVYGYERGERGAGGAPNPRKEICRRTLRAEHKFAHANILHAFSDALHFKSLEPLRSGITEGVSRQQVGLAGCYHDGGVLDVHYLSKSVTMEFIRDKANFPIRRGYFKVDRMITDVDTCFADKIFEPIYERLHTYIAARDDSESEARKKEVHESDRQLVILLRYLGVVLVQDLAFLVNRGDFVGHPILGHEFFRDDTYGFQTFRKEQQHDIKESQNTVERWVERLRRVLENAGETELAETFETMFETFTSKTVGNSGSLPPQQTSQHSSPSQPPIGSIVETCSGTLDASDVPSEPGTFSGNCSSPIPLIESSPAPFKPTAVASDVATWPKLPESKDLPDFVLCIRFGNDVKTVQDVADEYYRKFGENAGIREVELFYGPKVRNGSKAKGLSYRAKALYENGTRHFTRRNLIYRVLEEKGEVDGVRDLQARISEKFPGEEPKWPHIKWLQDDLNRENVMRNPKRSRIIKEAFEVKRQEMGAARALVSAPTHTFNSGSNGT